MTVRGCDKPCATTLNNLSKRGSCLPLMDLPSPGSFMSHLHTRLNYTVRRKSRQACVGRLT